MSCTALYGTEQRWRAGGSHFLLAVVIIIISFISLTNNAVTGKNEINHVKLFRMNLYVKLQAIASPFPNCGEMIH